MDIEKNRRYRKAEIFFWGVLVGITFMGLEQISWLIKIVLAILIILGWIYYIFNPPPIKDKSTKVSNNSVNAKRNLIVVSVIVVITAIVTLLLISNFI